MTMMVKNCPTYNQIILPIALVSICALFKFNSSNALLDTGKGSYFLGSSNIENIC
jgi:hypothetical protein